MNGLTHDSFIQSKPSINAQRNHLKYYNKPSDRIQFLWMGNDVIPLLDNASIWNRLKSEPAGDRDFSGAFRLHFLVVGLTFVEHWNHFRKGELKLKTTSMNLSVLRMKKAFRRELSNWWQDGINRIIARNTLMYQGFVCYFI